MNRLGAVACLKFLATENMPWITVKLRIVDYSRQWICAIPWRMATKRSHNFGVGSGLKTYSRRIFAPTPKIWRGKKPQIYVNLPNTAISQKHVTSKRLNISTNDYHVSSRINTLQNSTKLWSPPQGVYLQPREIRAGGSSRQSYRIIATRLVVVYEIITIPNEDFVRWISECIFVLAQAERCRLVCFFSEKYAWAPAVQL